MAVVLALPVGIALLAIASAPAQERLANGYLELVPRDGQVEVRFDPSGGAAYAQRAAAVAPFRLVAPGGVQVEGSTIRFRGARYMAPGAATGGNSSPFDLGQDLPAGGSLGQTFTIPQGGWVHEVSALLTCSGVDGSRVTMRLRRDGAGGPIIAEERARAVPEQGDAQLRLPEPAAPGTYYLELSEKHGGCYWWACRGDVFPAGQAFIDGQPQPDKDFRLTYKLADVGALDWQVRLDGGRLQCTLTVREQAIQGFRPPLALSFPWEREGYGTTDPATTPFRYLFTDTGHWFPVHAFKRLETDWALEPTCGWARLRGTNGYDLRLAHGRDRLQPYLDSDRLHLLLGADATVEVLPESDELPEYFPRFLSSDAELDPVLNEFLLTFLTSHTSCPSSFEWDGLKLAWVGGPIHDSLGRVILHFTHRIDPDGYIWSRGESRGWDGRDCSEFDSRHYDSNAPFILACWRWYCWTGDEQFLDACLGTVRRATDYLLGPMHGRDGLLTIDSPNHTGIGQPSNQSWPSDYWDCIPAGYQVAYINAFYAPALAAAADLERAAGNAARAEALARLVAVARRRFNEAFWDDRKGRYVGWVDVNGNPHDWGMTCTNTIAATHGLANREQARRVSRWLHVEQTSSGQSDTFTRWVFAPRSNTIHCEEQANRFRYDEWCEDGGAILWTAFYDVMSRARFLGPDDAWQRFCEVLRRFALPDHLVGGSPFFRGEINNHGDGPGSVGTWGEFPESGIVPCAFLYGFMGVRAELDGLHVRPSLPTDLTFAGVEGLVYRGHRLKITAYRDMVVVEGGNRVLRFPVKAGAEVVLTEATLEGI